MNESSIPLVEDVENLMNNIQKDIVEHGKEGVVNYIPQLEMEFEYEISSYDFYNEYNKKIGFGIRREYGNKSKKDEIQTSRRFVCFKEGNLGVDKRDYLTKEHRAETKTRCAGHMCISLDRKILKYKVVVFIPEHNHDLQPQEFFHMIRSHRRIYESQSFRIVLADESGLKPKDFHEYISKHVGGKEMIGYTSQNHMNYLQPKRIQSPKYGEVGALMMHFKQQSENPSFFYEFQIDVEEQI